MLRRRAGISADGATPLATSPDTIHIMSVHLRLERAQFQQTMQVTAPDVGPPQLPPAVRDDRRVAPDQEPASTTRAGIDRRPFLLTFGSILQPNGGLQVRTRVLAETLAGLGCPSAVVSTREPGTVPHTTSWARSLRVPQRESRAGVFRDLVRLTRDAAAVSDMVIISDATLLPVLTAARVSLPLVWDTNECQSLHYGRLRSPRAAAKRVAWIWLERWAGRRCSVAVAIGEREASHWRRLHPEFGGKVVTVDHAPFIPTAASLVSGVTLERIVGRQLHGPLLVFAGSLAGKHNAPAAQWIIDVLAPSLSDVVTIVICGPGTEKLSGGSSGARVDCLGMVDEIDTVIAGADLCLAPLTSGAGVKTKVLHYLAHGRRVVGTPIAFEGLAGAPGLIETSLESMPGVIAGLLDTEEPDEAGTTRVAAQRAWMESHHSRLRVATQWQEILECLPR